MPHGTLTRITRRAAIAGSIASISAVTVADATPATPSASDAMHVATPVASPMASPAVAAEGRHLFVADPKEKAIYICSIPDGKITGQIDGIAFGNHAGTFQMPDGRLLFADLDANEIVALTVDSSGTPTITQRVAADFGGGVAWIVANETFSHVAFGSLKGSHDEMEMTQTLNVLDTKTFSNTSLQFEMAAPEEIHAWLLGDPMQVHVAVGGRVDSYTWADLQAGVMKPLASVEVDMGSHGGLTDAANQRIYYVTAPKKGFDVLDVATGKVVYLKQIPWDLDGQTGGRNARPRVTRDGTYAIGVMTPGLEDTSVWADTMVSNHIVNLEDMTATRAEIAPGSFGYRWQLSDNFALWAAIGKDGSRAHLLDLTPENTTFGTSVGTIDIKTPTRAPKPGTPWNEDGDELYIMTTITADSAYGFATISGDGIIQVLDIASKSVVGEIALPTKMVGGGYSCVIEPAQTPVDLWGR